MSSATSTDVSHLDVAPVTLSSAAPVSLSAFEATVVYNFPADFAELSDVDTAVVTESDLSPAYVSSLDVIAVYKGRVDDPRLTAWTFTLDGHDFYVLKLGNIETLVYDTLSQEWYVWGSGESDLWRAYCGTNWRGAQRHGPIYGSDVVVGDDGNGSIYILNPDADFDDDAVSGASIPRRFTRTLTVQYVVPGGFSYYPCFGIQVFGSVGQADEALSVSLEASDDRGQSYFSFAPQSVSPDAFDYRLEWMSLGTMRAPGRLFRISDDGALHRVDEVHMYVPDGE